MTDYTLIPSEQEWTTEEREEVFSCARLRYLRLDGISLQRIKARASIPYWHGLPPYAEFTPEWDALPCTALVKQGCVALVHIPRRPQL